jgi:FkbM family methyltransferase
MYFPSAYDLKRFLLYPRTLYMRWRERQQVGFIRSALELHYYRPAFYRFIGATMEKPDILHEAALDTHSIVLDVGAFTGEWSQKISQRYAPSIHAFEPNPRSYEALREKQRQFPGLHPIPWGLGATSETTRISLRGLGSSIYPNARADEGAEWEEVRILAVDEAWSDLQLDQVDLMKINIEGAEFPLLERMIECDLLPRVKCFLIQFHEWHPRAYGRRKRIRQALARTHQLDWDYHFVWERWTRRDCVTPPG